MKSIKKTIPKEIKVNDVIPYVWRTDNYGVAEFELCPVFKNGYMEKLFIYRKQQIERDAFVINIKKTGLKIKTFMVESWISRTEAPRIWRNMWCKEHKCVLFEVYVPHDTNQIKFTFHFGDTLSIRFENTNENF